MADRRREAPLAMDGGAFRDAGHRLVDQIAELLDSLPARSVTTQQSPSSIREALNLNGPLPEEGTDPATLLADLPRQLFDHSLFNAHPRFFGYITAPAAPIGILADFLASALNANVGAWRLGPAATEIETQTVRWIAELIGYPSNCAAADEQLDRVQRSGEAFVSNAVVHGRYVLRACIVNFHTERQDVEALLEIVARLGRKLDRERRPASMN